MDKRMVLRKLFIKCLLQEINGVIADELIQEIQKLEKGKRLWVRKWIARRKLLGGSNLLMRELALEDANEYQKIMRMTVENFNFLLDRIGDKIQKKITIMREAIPAYMKLQVTLDYLATGNSLRSLQKFYRISMSSISSFLPEVMDAISDGLSEYLKVPVTEAEWNKIESGFRNRWHFPDCYGALDGKHIRIRAPPHSGSDFFNYHETFSVILMALVDYDYFFSYVNIGANGRSSDGGVYQNSALCHALENGMLPHEGCVVADDAFPLKPYLMKPYSRTQLTTDKKVFNYRLSRARRIVENAFGILVSRFRVFETPISLRIEVVEKIVRAACTLHNFLRKTSNNIYMPSGSVDYEDLERGLIIEGSWRSEKLTLLHSITNENMNPTRKAKLIRDKYKDYFMNTGEVDWQLRMIS